MILYYTRDFAPALTDGFILLLLYNDDRAELKLSLLLSFQPLVHMARKRDYTYHG